MATLRSTQYRGIDPRKVPEVVSHTGLTTMESFFRDRPSNRRTTALPARCLFIGAFFSPFKLSARKNKSKKSPCFSLHIYSTS